MIVVYIAVTVVAASAYAYAAYMNFVRHESVIRAAERVHAPQSWMLPLGSLLAAGAVGLLVGFALPIIGTAAGIGLVLYFICAVGAHLRVRDPFGLAAAFLLLAVAALSVSLAHRGLA